jgi:CBS domain-containing protein
MNAVHPGRPVVFGVDGSEASPPPWTWPSVKPSPGNAGYGWSPRTVRVRRRSPANAQVQRPRWRSAAAVTARLTTSGLRHLVVVSGHRCVGVLSDRHVAAWPFGELSRRAQIVLDLLGDTRPSVTARTTAAEAARAMLDAGVDALPVVDAHNRVVGLVTGSDLLRLLADTAKDSPEDAQPAVRQRRPAPD